MRKSIECIANKGFWQHLNHQTILKIWCDYETKLVTIFYKTGQIKTIDIDIDVYNSQYGVTVTEDGAKIIIGSWEKKKGLRCYKVENGDMLWHLQLPKIRSVILFDDYLSVVQGGKSLMKVSLETGEILAEIKSSTIEKQFLLFDSYIFLSTLKGKNCVFDTQSMRKIKDYPNSLINPNDCLSIIINDVEYCGTVKIIGFEEYAHGTYEKEHRPMPYERIIDMNFM